MKSKEEIASKHLEPYDDAGLPAALEDVVWNAMDEYAKQEAIEFFKWNAIKVSGYIEYLTRVKNAVTSKEIEERLNEFEGATIAERYELYLKDKENQLTIG